MATAEPRVMVHCCVCQIQYDCSARTDREIRAGTVEPRCKLHRGRKRKRQTNTALHRRFWLDRFSMEEIQEMAVALFPRPSDRAPSFGTTLTASGAPPGPPELGGQ